MLTGFQGSHFVCRDEGVMLVLGCVKYVDVLSFEWQSLDIEKGVLGGSGCVLGGVDGWVSEF